MKKTVQKLALMIVATGMVASSAALAQRPPLDPEDVFIDADTDDFDPGLPIGADFPPIRALYQGQEISDIDQFIRDKGAVFIANRSVDW
jgi:hypothetical protein